MPTPCPPASLPCNRCHADAAVISRVGRAFPGMWKWRNQDAWALAPAGPDALLLGVFDGHSVGGERASAEAARAVAAALADQPLPAGASPEQQQHAAVAALQRAAADMQAGGGYERCGAAAAVCLAAPGCVTAAWAGDCRAVAGLCLADGTVQVQALTQDHKPGRCAGCWLGVCRSPALGGAALPTTSAPDRRAAPLPATPQPPGAGSHRGHAPRPREAGPPG